MAHVTTVIRETPNAITYRVAEAGTAVGAAEQRDVIGDLAVGGGAGGPLTTILNNGGLAIANQAAAAALWDAAGIEATVTPEAATSAGATAKANLTVIPNINGGAVGNFALDIAGIKAVDADTATFVLTVRAPHSLVD